MSNEEKIACLELTKLLSPLKAKLLIQEYKTPLKALSAGIISIEQQNSEYIYEDCENLDNCIFYFDEEYPKKLLEIDDYPLVLYYVGNKTILNDETFSVIGSRHPTEYGYFITNKFVKDLVNLGFTTVSGMALGIDAFVHNKTIDYGGKTIAVLGGGIKCPYPKQNTYIYEKIINNGGLVISEFYNIKRYQRWIFPRRNRIIAGISDNLLITEAKKNSGTIGTAELASDYYRNVYAVPGSLNNINSEGCNEMIKRNKAYMLTEIEDLYSQ